MVKNSPILILSLIEYINESNNIELVSDDKEHGFEYVDLGLPSKTMWASSENS